MYKMEGDFQVIKRISIKGIIIQILKAKFIFKQANNIQ